MVKKSLHEAGFSNEAIIACVRHDIHYADELMKYYLKDPKLRIFDNITAVVKEEILQKCSEVEISQKEKKKKLPDITVEKGRNKRSLFPDNIKEKTTLEELVEKGILSKKTWQALATNNIHDVGSLLNHYVNNNNSFRGLRQVGTLKNNEAIWIAQLCIDRNLTGKETTEAEAVFLFNASNVLPEKLKMLFNLRKNELKRSMVLFFEKEVIPVKDPEKLAVILNRLMKNPGLIPSMGKRKGVADLENFLNEYQTLCTDDRSQSALEKDNLIHRIRKLAWIDEDWVASNDLEFDKPLQIVYNIIRDARTLKNNEQFILRNVNTLRIFEEGQGLKYEDALKKYNESQDSSTVMNTFKVWIKRTRTKLEELLRDIANEIPELKAKLLTIFSLPGDFVIFPAERTDVLNKHNETDFTERFFDLLISSLNPGYMSLCGSGIRRFNEPGFIKSDFVSDKKKFEVMTKIIGDEIVKTTSKERRLDLISMTEGCLKREFDISNLVEFLKTQNNEIRYDKGILILPPTLERRKKLGELVYKIIEDNLEPMHYDAIVRKFREENPDVNLRSYRSLRDAMDRSNRIFSMGGRSNRFLLDKWKTIYFVGPNKEFIIDFLKKKQPAHFYEIFMHLSEKRPGLRIITVTDVLMGLPDLFYHHGGGYYSLAGDRVIDRSQTFPRLQSGVYSLIKNIIKQSVSHSELIRILRERFPSYSDVQLEYAVYQVSERQV
ncbi:MAG TPA: hypothetical protein PLV06_06070 [Bacteroidales bacterium]|nr:hypothetical protein [Bacteroidales bacterium]HPF02256.1 hypothetical protein [Bacteroidales bacterium]HPJ58784.1 hypothetical protein [Bacteroidales bacterium]HPR11934.1 hypothetical protein [Bacteroidales bacterium]HRW85367.1 hypothetical protein [Bacteroidales bacterium]